MKIFIGMLCCLFFGARVCSGVSKASSDANQQVLTGSDDKVSQLLLDVFKRRVNESEWDGEGLYHSDIEESNNQGNLFARTTPNYCKRHAMTIDFDSSFGEKNPYIAPSSFRAYYCSGECPFPIPNHMDPTMHAIVQRIMNSVDSKWPLPCCVPTKLSPIKVLYFDDNDETVKVKIMKKMVAEKCGCR